MIYQFSVPCGMSDPNHTHCVPLLRRSQRWHEASTVAAAAAGVTSAIPKRRQRRCAAVVFKYNECLRVGRVLS